jgi:hypothetical protein
MTVVAGTPEDFTLETFRRVTVDREGVVIGPAAIRVMGGPARGSSACCALTRAASSTG